MEYRRPYINSFILIGEIIMMNKIKNTLRFIAGGIYASFLWLAFVVDSTFFIVVLFTSMVILGLVVYFFLEHWDDN